MKLLVQHRVILVHRLSLCSYTRLVWKFFFLTIGWCDFQKLFKHRITVIVFEEKNQLVTLFCILYNFVSLWLGKWPPGATYWLSIVYITDESHILRISNWIALFFFNGIILLWYALLSILEYFRIIYLCPSMVIYFFKYCLNRMKIYFKIFSYE